MKVNKKVGRGMNVNKKVSKGSFRIKMWGRGGEGVSGKGIEFGVFNGNYPYNEY